LAQNIFWQIAQGVTLEEEASFKGVILSQINIALKSGAAVKGRLFTQTAVTLIASTVAQP
jgi:hypothetical protein